MNGIGETLLVLGGFGLGALAFMAGAFYLVLRLLWHYFGAAAVGMLSEAWKNRLSVKLQVAPPLPPLDPALILRPDPVRPEDRPS